MAYWDRNIGDFNLCSAFGIHTTLERFNLVGFWSSRFNFVDEIHIWVFVYYTECCDVSLLTALFSINCCEEELDGWVQSYPI
jgi:hypothetical protein